MKKFNSNISEVIELLANLNLLYHVVRPCSFSASEKFKKASFSGVPYREVYDIGVSNQDFNFSIKDGAFFQFYKCGSDVRLAYYPNPYEEKEVKKYLQDLIDMQNELTQEEYDQFISEIECNGNIPAIRYDLSYDQYCPKYHPTAHFHIGYNAENRWPVRKILTPFTFCFFILRNYYMEKWKEIEEKELALDEVYERHVLNCDLIEDNFFSKEEEKKLYFT